MFLVSVLSGSGFVYFDNNGLTGHGLIDRVSHVLVLAGVCGACV